MGRKRRNNVYRHYMLQEESQTSTCLLCYKTLNTTHGSNLMNHLKFMHKSEYQQILALNRSNVPPITSPPRDSPNSIMCSDDDDDPLNFSKLDDDDSNQSDPGLEVDVEKFFNMDRSSSRARCDICQASVDVKGNSLMNHLKREHPKILKPGDDDSDAGEQDELYQEIVYLYDSDSKSPSNVRSIKVPSSTPMSSLQKHKAKLNSKSFKRPSISLENRKRRRTQDSTTSPPVDQFSEELENFGKYVTCLMKTVPEELCAQLQMDIINLIMTAKIKNMSRSDASTSLVQKSDNVPTETFDQPVIVSVDASKLDNASLPSPESNTAELKTVDKFD